MIVCPMALVGLFFNACNFSFVIALESSFWPTPINIIKPFQVSIMLSFIHCSHYDKGGEDSVLHASSKRSPCHEYSAESVKPPKEASPFAAKSGTQCYNCIEWDYSQCWGEGRSVKYLVQTKRPVMVLNFSVNGCTCVSTSNVKYFEYRFLRKGI